MEQLINISGDSGTLGLFADSGELRRFYEGYGCRGVELILCGEEFYCRLEPGMVRGLHLVFYPEWISLWQNDVAYLDWEFGGREQWQSFYDMQSGQELLERYRHELALAERLGAEYVVFHMGDNPLDDYFTLNPRRSPREQMEGTCDFLNRLFAQGEYSFDLLLENMWTGCMNLTDPALTRLALEGIRYPRTGIMLDTGHLLATNPALTDMEESCRYIHRVLDDHGELAERIWGVHLHGELTGAYQSSLPMEPPSRRLDYLQRFAIASRHLRQIDPHQPFVAAGLPELVRRIEPKYLCHELQHGGDLTVWNSQLKRQTDALAGRTTNPA